MNNRLILTKAIDIGSVSSFNLISDENLLSSFSSIYTSGNYFGKMDIYAEEEGNNTGGCVRSSLISISFNTSTSSWNIDECVIFLSDAIGITVVSIDVDMPSSLEAYLNISISLPNTNNFDFRLRAELYGIFDDI